VVRSHPFGLGYHPFVSSIVLGLFSIILLVVIALSGWAWAAAPVKADIVNQEFGTNYTAKQIYFASDVIDEIRDLKRARIEVKGDQVEKVVAVPTR